jgi:hypothetical protein
MIRTFQTFWESLPLSTRERMNMHDAEFVWIAQSANMPQYKLQGRREALRDLIHEFDSHDYFKERDLTINFYKTDKSYVGDYDE